MSEKLITLEGLKTFKEKFEKKLISNQVITSFHSSSNLNIPVQYTTNLISIIGGANSNTLYSTIYLYTEGSYVYLTVANNNASVYVENAEYSNNQLKVSFNYSVSGLYNIISPIDAKKLSTETFSTTEIYNTYASSSTSENIDVLQELGFNASMTASRSNDTVTITGVSQDQIRVYGPSDIQISTDDDSIVLTSEDTLKIVRIGNDSSSI